jgi:hypothetical protein
MILTLETKEVLTLATKINQLVRDLAGMEVLGYCLVPQIGPCWGEASYA